MCRAQGTWHHMYVGYICTPNEERRKFGDSDMKNKHFLRGEGERTSLDKNGKGNDTKHLHK